MKLDFKVNFDNCKIKKGKGDHDVIVDVRFQTSIGNEPLYMDRKIFDLLCRSEEFIDLIRRELLIAFTRTENKEFFDSIIAEEGRVNYPCDIKCRGYGFTISYTFNSKAQLEELITKISSKDFNYIRR